MENGGVTRFVFERGLRRPLQLWPWMISHFRQLRAFRFNGYQALEHPLVFSVQKITSKEIRTLSPGLRQLVIRGDSELRQSVVDLIFSRFHELEHIQLPVRPHQLPAEPLHALKFLESAKFISTGPVTSEDVQKLPRTVNSLHLIDMTFDVSPFVIPENVTELSIKPRGAHVYAMASVFKCLLPSKLTSFSYSAYGDMVYHPIEAWSTLPRTLTNLETTIRAPDFTVLLIQCLPPDLRRLKLKNLLGQYKYTVPILRALPIKLETLHTSPIIVQNDWLSMGKLFPDSLTKMPIMEFTFVQDIEVPLVLPSNLKSLKSRHINFGTLNDLPPRLTKFTSNDSFNLEDFPLPSSITLLQMPMNRKWSLPSKLVRLMLAPDSGTDLCIDEGLKTLVHLNCLTHLELSFKWCSPVDDSLWSSYLPASLTFLAVRGTVSKTWLANIPRPSKLTTLLLFHQSSDRTDPCAPDCTPFTDQDIDLVPDSVEDLLYEIRAEFDPVHLSLLRDFKNLVQLTISAPIIRQLHSSVLYFLPTKLSRLLLFKGGTHNSIELVQEAAKIGIDVRFPHTLDKRVF